MDYEVSSPQEGLVLRHHSVFDCAGKYCVVHNPSDHHMKTWPMVWRSDRRRLWEKERSEREAFREGVFAALDSVAKFLNGEESEISLPTPSTGSSSDGG